MDQTLGCKGGEVIFCDEIMWDDRQLYFDILRSIEWCAKVEIGNIKAWVFGIWCGEYAVEQEFDHFKRARMGTSVTRADLTAAVNGDPVSMGSLFVHQVHRLLACR